MKQLAAKMFAYGFIIVLFVTMPVKLVVHYSRHGELIDLMEMINYSMFSAVVMALIYVFFSIQHLKPKIKFLNTDSPIEKRFGNVESSVNVSSEDFDFEKLVKSLKRDFVVTYWDENEKMIKLRDQFRFWSFGAGAEIRFDSDCVKINSFTLYSSRKKLANILTDKIKGKIKETTAP